MLNLKTKWMLLSIVSVISLLFSLGSSALLSPKVEALCILSCLDLEITAPANNSAIYTGRSFKVCATVTNTGPGTSDAGHGLVGAGAGYLPGVGPRYLPGIPSCDVDVILTIAISGPATLGSGNQATVTRSSLASGDSWDVCWNLKCLSEGKVTITITATGSDTCRPEGWSETIEIWQIPNPEADQSGGGQTWPKPPQIAVRNVQTSSAQVTPNQPVTVMANVVNTGQKQGLFSATFKVNGQVEEVREGMLEGQTGVPLQFVYFPTQPGTYTVDINGETTYFTVVGAGSGTGDTASSMAGSTIFVIVISLLALGAAIVLVRRFV